MAVKMTNRYAICPVCGYRMKEKEPRTYTCMHCKGETAKGCDRVSVAEAAFLWNLNGRRKDLLFGYAEEELAREADRAS